MSSSSRPPLPPRVPHTTSPALHLLLPATLLFAAFLSPSVPTLPYLLAFLWHSRAYPRRRFPYTTLALLLLYALLAVALHITVAVALARTVGGDAARVRARETLEALGVPRYDEGVWRGLRTLLGHVAVVLVVLWQYGGRHAPSGRRYVGRAFLLIRAAFAVRKERRRTRQAGTPGTPGVSSMVGGAGVGDGGDVGDGRGRRRRRGRRGDAQERPRGRGVRKGRGDGGASGGASGGNGLRNGGWMTLEQIEAVVGDGYSDDDEESIVRRLTAHELDLAALNGMVLDGGGGGEGDVDGERGDADSGEEVELNEEGDALVLDDLESRLDGVEAQRAAGVTAPEEPTLLTQFMAGHGGVLWSTLSAALLGTSYSSILTFLVLLPTLIVIVTWAFKAPKFAPKRHVGVALRFINTARCYLLLYLVAIYVFQLAWLDSFRETAEARLIGLVSLDTGVGGGWSHVMAVGAAVVCWVFTSMLAKAITVVSDFGEYVEAVGGLPSVSVDYEAEDARAESGGEGFRMSTDGEEVGSEIFGISPVAGSVATLESLSKAGAVIVASPLGARLSFNMESLLGALMHLSTLGLLMWALVFPGLLTLPLLVASFANLLSRQWQNRRVVDKLIWYAVALEMIQFAFAAITNAFDIFQQPIVRLLGLRTFSPQFAMNLIQTVAIALLAINIYAKGRLHAHREQANADAALRSAPTGQQMDSTLVAYFSDFSIKTNAYAPLKVFVDQLALAALYVTGGYEASVLNVLFLFALVAICLFQATRVVTHKKLLSYTWTGIMFYSAAFLLVNGAVCRASKEQFTCNSPTLGLRIATTEQTVAYATTVVMAAVQVHYTWPSARDNRDSEHLPEFRTTFWTFLREYYIYFAYGALLLYPLVYPANYLSYCYFVLLWVCILVEILATNVNLRNLQVQGARGIIHRFWFVIVLFASLALLARYFVRFDQFQNSEATRLWVFGHERGVRDFQITLGDAIVLIMMSLQGRIFNISHLLSETSSSASGTAAIGGAARGSATRVSSRTGGFDSETAEALGLRPARAPAPARQTAAAEPVEPLVEPLVPPLSPRASNTSPASTAHLVASGDRPPRPSERRGIRFADEHVGAQGGFGSFQRRSGSLRRSRVLSDGELGGDVAVVGGGVEGLSDLGAQQAKTMMKRLRSLRKSLPVKQTERFLSSSAEYVTVVIRSLLLQYNYVFEAIAILVAAVWLDGVTVFGAIYLAIGCVLMISEQFVRETMEERRARWTSSLFDGVASDAASNKSAGSSKKSSKSNKSNKSNSSSPSQGADRAGKGQTSSFFQTGTATDMLLRMTSSWSARYLPPVLVILSFALMSIQYLYLILSSSGVVDETKPWGQKALYFGLQAVPTISDASGMEVADREILPLRQRAMLAHVLVFVMAFLQRVAVRWITMDERKAREEEQSHVHHMAAPLTADVYTSAVSVVDVMPGVGGGRTPNGESSGLAGEEIGNEITSAGFENESFAPYRGQVVLAGVENGKEPAPEPSRSSAEMDGSSPPLSEDQGADAAGASSSSHVRTPLPIPEGVSVEGGAKPFPSSTQTDDGFPGLRSYFTGNYGFPKNVSQRSGSSTGQSIQKFGRASESVGSSNEYLDVEFMGGPVEQEPSMMQRLRHFVLLAFRTIGKRSAEIFSLLTPFWENWGFDLTFIYLVIGGAVTQTFFSVVYVVFVLVLGRLEKKALGGRWRSVTLTLVALVALQYLLTLGLPPTGDSGGQIIYPLGLSEDWARWFYIDSLTRAAVFREALSSRKFGITFGFLAVICAGVTYNALADEKKKSAEDGEDVTLEDGSDDDPLSPGSSGRQQRISDPGDLAATAAERVLPEREARVRIVRYQPAGIAVRQPAPGGGLRRVLSGLGQSRSAIDFGALESAQGAETGDFAASRSFDGLASPTLRDNGVVELTSSRDVKPDFTSRPLSFRNWVKLSWMRFAGSLVQLVMFAVATLDTNLLSAVLLAMAFYFFFQFTNTETKQTRFIFVRTYVLVVILILVIYQAPFAPPQSNWARIIGLYKVSGEESNVLLYYMLALWLLCQMQGRIYESENFQHVVNSTRQDEEVRHRRAVQEHNDRLYEKMLGRNKNKRDHAARQARVKALGVLAERNEQPPTEVFFRVCVTNWVAYLKKRASSPEVEAQKQTEKQEQDEKNELTGEMSKFERALRYLCRGRKWVSHSRRPISKELRLFVTRYSSWPVYFTMTLAAVYAPSILTLVYPIVLYMYLILEQPRPPRQAWTALLVYVYIVILLKYIGRKSDFNSCAIPVPFIRAEIPLTAQDEEPSFTNLNYCAMSWGIFFDVLVLLSLMWHRTQLYYRGLWDLPRSEEELRNYKNIKGEFVDETPVNMMFTGFEEADVPRGYSFGRAGSGVASSDPSAANESRRYSFVSRREQCSFASDVLQRASNELTQVAVATGADDPDADALAGTEDGENKEQHHGNAITALFGGRDAFRPEKFSKWRGSGGGSGGSGGGGGGNSSTPRSTGQQLAEMFGSPPPRPSVTAAQGRPHSDVVESVPPSGSQQGAQVALRADVYEPNAADLRQRRGQGASSRDPFLDSQLRTRTSDRPGSALEGSSIQRASSQRMGDGGQPSSMLANLLSSTRRRSGGLHVDELGDGAEVDRETQGDAMVFKSLADARLTAHTAPQMRPDSAGKLNAEPLQGQKLSAVRSNGDGGGAFWPVRRFFANLLDESPHKTVGDYYMAMFSIDFVCFIYIMFGHSYIFGAKGQIRSWWESNFIGRDHLTALLIMFLGIVVDRIVYLRKSMLGKLVIQYVSVLGYHYWLFWNTNIGSRSVGQGFYFLKCIYFVISGLQIRTGYPLYTTGQYLLRRYNTPGIIAFTLYENIPFLWLTRTLLDWAVVPTSLELFQYLRFIDIYMWLYRNRAVNTARGLFRRKLGQKRKWFPRAYQGFGLALLCGLLLFLPFILFSFLNPFVDSRSLAETHLRVDFVSGNRTYDVFGRRTLTQKIEQSGARAETVQRRYGVNVILGENENLYEANFAPLSESLWLPVEADIDNLVESLEANTATPQLRFSLMAMTRSQVFRLSAELPLENSTRKSIATGLKGRKSFSARIETPLSHHLILASGSNTFEEADRFAENRASCLRFIFQDGSEINAAAQGIGRPMFWSIEDCVDAEICSCNVVDEIEGTTLFDDAKEHAVIVLLQVADVSSFQFGGGTILTVYVAILFTVASLAKRLFANKRLIVPYVDMPYTLHLYQLVLDIVYARQAGFLHMEEILYNGLIDIYRDPHEMVKWSGQRALKVDEEWWSTMQADGQLIEGYDGWPSFRETETEPYIERVVE